MSTTDPSAAKPDDFAIGSISKRDRSGSGDEAAPVYPVKHPTMSYAGAAKGRPAAQKTRSLLAQSRDRYSPYMKELETCRFMNGVRVVRTLILDRIKCLPTPLNQCPVGMESIEGPRGVG
ncbi:hypothetical protein BB560_005147 [Smittium megazygosporum]|uniref:Uncharacterized protein n=1 Tax=Smittium megazygosporum TaxID=133381 RepID=A0A2T9Z796_9FUNG|nr:hypothetical protein BB560_005147 [Smittium megazygosporum]